jgi:hypothetical protein
MKHLILSAALLFCGRAFAQATSSDSLTLRLPGPTSYPEPGQTIRIERQDAFVVFTIESQIPRALETGTQWSLGPHVPYPVRQLDFYVPESMCRDLLNCDTGSQLVNVAEVHITGQHAGRQAGLHFSIQKQEGAGFQVDAWMTDPEGNVEATHLSLLEVK